MSLTKAVQQLRLCTYSEPYEKKSEVAVYLNGMQDQATELQPAAVHISRIEDDS